MSRKRSRGRGHLRVAPALPQPQWRRDIYFETVNQTRLDPLREVISPEHPSLYRRSGP